MMFNRARFLSSERATYHGAQGVREVVRHAGLEERLGRERMLFNARMAIERYQALQSSEP
jgi:hypothetical protein